MQLCVLRSFVDLFLIFPALKYGLSEDSTQSSIDYLCGGLRDK